MANFVALDFETANQKRDSACALGMVKVVDGAIVEQAYRLIDPDTYFAGFCVGVHGITEDDVVGESCFDEVWAELAPLLAGADFLAAHNAPFDRSVLKAGCERFGLRPPGLPFACTLATARKLWPELGDHRLPTVCDYLAISLDHHHALSDAEACAKIVLHVTGAGYQFDQAGKVLQSR